MIKQDTPIQKIRDMIFSFASALLREQTNWAWDGQALGDFAKDWRITEEVFDLFYGIISKQLKTLKVKITFVSAVLKKVNVLRSQVVIDPSLWNPIIE